MQLAIAPILWYDNYYKWEIWLIYTAFIGTRLSETIHHNYNKYMYTNWYECYFFYRLSSSLCYNMSMMAYIRVDRVDRSGYIYSSWLRIRYSIHCLHYFLFVKKLHCFIKLYVLLTWCWYTTPYSHGATPAQLTCLAPYNIYILFKIKLI